MNMIKHRQERSVSYQACDQTSRSSENHWELSCTDWTRIISPNETRGEVSAEEMACEEMRWQKERKKLQETRGEELKWSHPSCCGSRGFCSVHMFVWFKICHNAVQNIRTRLYKTERELRCPSKCFWFRLHPHRHYIKQ